MLTSEFAGSFDGTLLHYKIHRHRKNPALVFIHGIASNHLTWGKIAPEFGDRTYVMVDLRNHGLSGFGTFSIERAARDVAELINREHIKEFIPVGMSVGAQVAVELAKKYPKRAKKLVLVSPSSKRLIRASAWWAAVMRTVRQLLQFVPKRNRLRLTPNEDVPAVVSPFYGLRGMHARDVAAAVEASVRAPLDLACVHVPTLMITGSEDVLLNKQELSRLAAKKRVEWVTLPTNHLVLTRMPMQTTILIKKFIGAA